ncbi:MAG TPA: HupE/UreJ family protein [Methylomirabilota bacterium]|nr:HupE/UreJ family protein [Methylomirabilota bacterium]
MTRAHQLRRASLLAPLLLMALPPSVQAHGAIKGLEGFASGLVHPLTIPAHVLVILSLGLLAGQQTPQRLRAPMFVLMPALACALLFTLTRVFTGIPQPIPIALALCAAVLVAVAKPVPMPAIQALFALGGIVLGLDSAPESVPLAITLKSLLGTWVIVVFLVFDVAYYSALAARRNWSQVGLRVLASWIIAVSVLMLAFALQKWRA